MPSVVGLLLLTSAVLKGYQVRTEPYSLLSESVVAIAVRIGTVAFEVFLGTLLLTGFRSPGLKWGLVTLFGFFLCVSSAKALTGATTCGCFGPVRVNPWLAVLIDLAVLGTLASPRANSWWGKVGSRGRRPRSIALSAVMAFATSAPTLAFALKPLTVEEGITYYENGRVALLSPEFWVGKAFPLLSDVEAGGEIARGQFRAVLYHHDCAACQRLIAQANIRGADIDASIHARRVERRTLITSP